MLLQYILSHLPKNKKHMNRQIIVAERKGMFIVFEGIDGSGKSTQIELFARGLKTLDKYNEYLFAREQTYRAKEIRASLKNDQDAFSSGERMAEFYIKDREEHMNELILPVLKARRFVLCDRYKLSTYAYQAVQGVPLEKLEEMHKQRGIINPDLTFFINTPADVAVSRLQSRGEHIEKFEQLDFQKELSDKYKELVRYAQSHPDFAGKVFSVNGENSPETVASLIFGIFCSFYRS